MPSRDARKLEKARAKKKAEAEAKEALRAAAAAATDNQARQDFLEKLRAAEERDAGRQSGQQEEFWRNYFGDLFQDADADASRELDFEEAEAALASLGVNEEERRFAFDAADADGGGTVDMQEFLRIAPVLSQINGGSDAAMDCYEAAAAPSSSYDDGHGYADDAPPPPPQQQSRGGGQHEHRERGGGRQHADDGEGGGARPRGRSRGRADGDEEARQREERVDPLGLGADDRRRAKRLFASCDVDGSGALDFDEFCKVMESLCPGLDQRNLQAAFRAVDVDGSGSVDYDEFVAGQKQLKQWRQKKKPKHTAARRAQEPGKIMCEAIDPAVASCLRFSLASIALSPFLLQTPRGLIRPAIVCGLFTSFGYVGQAIALQTASAAEVGFICSLAVVVCPLLDLLDGKQIPSQSWAAAALALVGVGVLEVGDSGVALSTGDLWAFAQPIGFGVTFYKTGKMMAEFPTQTLPITAIQVAVAAATSLVWLGLTGAAVDGATLGELLGSPAALVAVAWTGIVGSALTTTGLTVALGRVSSTEASVLLTTEPLWAALLAFWLLSESVGSNVLSGGALILLACLANALGAEAEDQPPPALEGKQEKRARGGNTRFPARIAIVRHGQSRGNVDESEYSRVPDWKVELTDLGKEQARATAPQLLEVLKSVGPKARLFIYCSPYMRCRQTLQELLSAAGIDASSVIIREEPRIREQDFGNFQDPAAMQATKSQRAAFGRFFFRFPNGESGADVYDRVSTWLESFYREMDARGNMDEDTVVLLCTHGLTGRLFLMRWFHWTVEEFEATLNPPNAQLLVMERDDCDDPHPWSRMRYRLTGPSCKAIGLPDEQALGRHGSVVGSRHHIGVTPRQHNALNDSRWEMALRADAGAEEPPGQKGLVKKAAPSAEAPDGQLVVTDLSNYPEASS